MSEEEREGLEGLAKIWKCTIEEARIIVQEIKNHLEQRRLSKAC